MSVEHTVTVREGIVGPGEPGLRVFESNYVVECTCGYRLGVASRDVKSADEAAARHLRDVERGWWKP